MASGKVKCCLILLLLVFAARAQMAPVAPKRPATDVYQGVSVTDDYQWLENGDSPETKAWVEKQNAYTLAYVNKLPQRAPILAFLKKSQQEISDSYFNFQKSERSLFAIKKVAANSGVFLVKFASASDKASEATVADMNTFLPQGVSQINWYVPDRDGKLVGMAVSTGGSEEGTLYVIDATTGKRFDDVIPGVQYGTGGGSMAWARDGKGFYYTRYPRAGERSEADRQFYQQIYHHKLGTALSEDTYVVGRDFPRVAEAVLQASPDGAKVLVSIENGDGGEYEHFLLQPGAEPHKIAGFEQRVVQASFGQDDSIWLLSRKANDRGELLQLASGQTELATAKVIVRSDAKASIEGAAMDGNRYLAMKDCLFVTFIEGGPEEIRTYDLRGKLLGNVPLPKASSVSPLVRLDGSAVMYSTQSYVIPETWFTYSGTGTPQALAFKREPKPDFSDIETVQLFAPSKDGTGIPMTVLMRKGTELNGSNPALLTGYGGYGISMSPYHLGATERLWFDAGGIFINTNLRGGAEYGEAWHRAGALTHKQNVFDDFAACAEKLIQEKYTSANRLAIIGGSNGGLLMGAELTQHPEMFRVVILFVGIYDMLRVELDPNGQYNVLEYGSVKDPAQFRALYGYSPYHHVKAGTTYPATLFITGDNDPRVNPAHSRKMLAALQANTIPGHPIMLLTSANAGHGLSTDVSEAMAQQADIFAFAFAQLGMMLKQQAEAPSH
jgi:prolyl oligopeptidase